jgi:hypothetical protein
MARRRWHQRGQRGDVDDAPVAARDHARQRAMRQLGERHDHHLQERCVARPFGDTERAGDPVPGVVHEGIDGEPATLEVAPQRRRGARVG